MRNLEMYINVVIM